MAAPIPRAAGDDRDRTDRHRRGSGGSASCVTHGQRSCRGWCRHSRTPRELRRRSRRRRGRRGGRAGDRAPFHDGDAVSVPRRLESVGDGDDGAALDGGGECLLGAASGRRVQQGGGLVEDEGVGIREQHSGERDVLGLGAAEPMGAEVGVESLGRSSNQSAPSTSRAWRSSSVAWGAAMVRLSRSESANTWCSWVTRTTCWRSCSGARSATSAPPTVTRPDRGRSMPAMRRPRVVLPAPDVPTTARCSPARTSRLTPWRTSDPS